MGVGTDDPEKAVRLIWGSDVGVHAVFGQEAVGRKERQVAGEANGHERPDPSTYLVAQRDQGPPQVLRRGNRFRFCSGSSAELAQRGVRSRGVRRAQAC